MMRARTRTLTIFLGATAAMAGVVGCKADAPALPRTSGDGGAGTGPSAGGKLATPSATAPSRTPLDTAPVRGSAPGAVTVVVQGNGARSAVGLVLPDGTFCVDAPLAEATMNRLRVVTVSQGGMSEPQILEVTQDATAPTPTDAPACVPPPGATPSCSDAQAACDPACNGCQDDPYQPNFFPNQAPALNMKTTYAGLRLCPCRADWFMFVAYATEDIKLTATYDKSSAFDLDIAVYHGADVLPTINGNAPVAASTAGTSGSNATRTITFSAPFGGAYYLRVAAPATATGNGGYTLTTQ